MKKLISLALALLLLCTGVTCYAESPATRSSNYFHRYGVAMGDAGNGVLSITFHCTGMGICDQLGVATWSVDKRTDEGWVNITGLRDGQTGSNVAAYNFGRYFYGVPGETYRVNVTFVCVMNGGCEFKSYTTASITMD